MVFDLLVYAYNSDSIQEVSEVLKKVLLLSYEAIINFSDKMLEDNSNEFIRILMKWSDDVVRDCTSKILSTAVNRMFGRIDLIEKAEAFMMNMINVIHTQAATNWTKFKHFFNLIKTVATAKITSFSECIFRVYLIQGCNQKIFLYLIWKSIICSTKSLLNHHFIYFLKGEIHVLNLNRISVIRIDSLLIFLHLKIDL